MVFIPIFQWYLHYPLVAVNTYYPLDHVNVWIMWNIPGFPWRFHTDPNIYHRRPPTAPAKVCMAPMFPSHEGLPGCLDGVLKRKRWAKRARLCQIFERFLGKNVRLCQIMPDFWKKCQILPDLGVLILSLMGDVLIWMGFHGASMDTSSKKKKKTPMN